MVIRHEGLKAVLMLFQFIFHELSQLSITRQILNTIGMLTAGIEFCIGLCVCLFAFCVAPEASHDELY